MPQDELGQPALPTVLFLQRRGDHAEVPGTPRDLGSGAISGRAVSPDQKSHRSDSRTYSTREPSAPVLAGHLTPKGLQAANRRRSGPHLEVRSCLLVLTWDRTKDKGRAGRAAPEVGKEAVGPRRCHRGNLAEQGSFASAVRPTPGKEGLDRGRIDVRRVDVDGSGKRDGDIEGRTTSAGTLITRLGRQWARRHLATRLQVRKRAPRASPGTTSDLTARRSGTLATKTARGIPGARESCPTVPRRT